MTFMSPYVDGQGAAGQDIFFFPWCVVLFIASELRLDSGYHFQRAEWFCDIVVGAHGQAVDLVDFFSLSCEEDDGIGVSFPDFPADKKSAGTRHHNVQDSQV